MQINHSSTAPDYNAGELRTGKLETKVLAVGKEGALDCYRMSLETAREEGGWLTPRHRHNVDQIRFQIEGEWVFGKGQLLRPGMVSYFPESIHYGPQDRQQGSKTLLCQFGGASRNGFMTPRERRKGYDDLIQKGRFENGAYTWIDEKGQKHNQEAYEAVWEHMHGRKIAYAPPRYDSVVNMYPESYVYVADPEQPGVAFKWVGCFTENLVRIGFIRVEPGATLTIGLHTAPQVFYLWKGAISHNGKVYGPETGFAVEAKEGPIELTGLEQTELYTIQLPTFGEIASDSLAKGTSKAA
jgi:hypothetical protein